MNEQTPPSEIEEITGPRAKMPPVQMALYWEHSTHDGTGRREIAHEEKGQPTEGKRADDDRAEPHHMAQLRAPGGSAPGATEG